MEGRELRMKHALDVANRIERGNCESSEADPTVLME
jgi:hypothetical protein